jgi:hypothetical protein
MADDADIVRQMIVHENELTNQRVQWLLTVQGLLFTALAFAWKDAKPLICPLCIVGVAVSVATILNVYFATRAVERLVVGFDKRNPEYKGPPIIGGKLRIGSVLNLFSPANLISIAMIVGWIIVLCKVS